MHHKQETELYHTKYYQYPQGHIQNIVWSQSAILFPLCFGDNRPKAIEGKKQKRQTCTANTWSHFSGRTHQAGLLQHGACHLPCVTFLCERSLHLRPHLQNRSCIFVSAFASWLSDKVWSCHESYLVVTYSGGSECSLPDLPQRSAALAKQPEHQNAACCVVAGKCMSLLQLSYEVRHSFKMIVFVHRSRGRRCLALLVMWPVSERVLQHT